MKTIQIFLRSLPWLIIMALIVWQAIPTMSNEKESVTINRAAILSEVEAMGKLELVKYNFKEITELTELSEEFLKIFKLGPDSKIALISMGEAVGCLDLSVMEEEDVSVQGDSVYIQLPGPELCYYKLDMEQTEIYSLQTNPLKDEGAFIQRAYRQAEREIKEAALASGILDQTTANAVLILKPLLERMTGKTILFTQKPDSVRIRLD